MEKLKPKEITAALEKLNVDVITASTTRPKGKNDSKPPHEMTRAALVAEVTKELKDLRGDKQSLPEERDKRIERWNDYLTFAFDRRKSTATFYREHKDNIQAIIDDQQNTKFKKLADRHLIWRYQQMPDLKSKTMNEYGITPKSEIAEAYLSAAIDHNAKFILGTVNNILKKRRRTDRDANSFSDTIIQDMRKKCREDYDPCVSAVSTYFTNPIKWIVTGGLTGRLAQEKFEIRQRVGIDLRRDEEGARRDLEVPTPDARNAEEGIEFVSEEGSTPIIDRLRKAAQKIEPEKAREIFLFKLDHPTMILEDVAKEFGGLQRERIRQIYASVAEQLCRIDPTLTDICKAIIAREPGDIDMEKLNVAYEPSPRQKEITDLIPIIREDIMELRSNAPRFSEVSSRIRKGGFAAGIAGNEGDEEPAMTRGERNALARETLQVITHLKKIVDSPYVDADFNVLNNRELIQLAFYAGGSPALTQFVDTHLEEIAKAARVQSEKDLQYGDKRKRSEELVDRYYECGEEELREFNKTDLNSLFKAPQSSNGTVPDLRDLQTIRLLAIEKVTQRHAGALL